MHSLPRILALAFLLTLVPPSASAQVLEREVTGTETWTLRTEVADVLVIRSGATLELRGTTLTVADRIVVERGGTLRLGPEGAVATTLQPTPGGRFWIDVQGHIESRGEPRTRITGIEGEGLDSVVLLPGGLKINGTAELSDVHVDNGTAGIIVSPGASLRLTDARFDNLYLMGVAVYGGTAVLERVHGTNNIIGVTGRGPDCRMEMRNSTMESWAANFQIVGCPTLVEDSRLLKGDNTVVNNGRSAVDIRRTRIEGYANTGLLSDQAAPVTLEEVTLEPAQKGRYGVRLEAGGTLALRQVRVGSHDIAGIYAGGAAVSFDDVEVAGSNGHGVFLVNGPDPTGLESVRFGAPTSSEGKTVAVQRQVAVTLHDEAGAPVGSFKVKLTDAAGTATEAQAQQGTASLPVETIGAGPDGRPQPRGPFTYEVEAAEVRDSGQWDGKGSLIALQLQAHQGVNWSWVLFAAGAALLLGAFGWRHLRRGPTP